MLIIQAPDEVYSIQNHLNVSLFLAGGITNCPNWQRDMISKLAKADDFDHLTIFNPRRDNFDIKDPNAAEQQIVWEYRRLREADLIAFWFAKGSLNPIVLYELGMWCNSRPDDPCFIGIDPEYERKQDVVLQTKLARPGLPISQDFNSFVEIVTMALRDFFFSDSDEN